MGGLDCREEVMMPSLVAVTSGPSVPMTLEQ